MAPVRPALLVLLAASAVAAVAAGVAAASGGSAAVRQGGGYTAGAAPRTRHPCSPTPPPPRGGYVVPAPPPRDVYVAGTRPPRPPPSGTSIPVAGTTPPVARTLPPVQWTPRPVGGTFPPVTGTLLPVASATPPSPTPSESPPPPSTPTPSPRVEAELPIPTLPPGCATPSVESVLSFDLFFSFIGWQWQATLAVCDAAGARFRLTVYTAPAGATEPATRVYQAVEDRDRGGGRGGGGVTRVNVPESGGLTVNRSCEPRTIYGEACVADPTTGAPVCARTETRLVGALPPPALRINEPAGLPSLVLAPGDAVTLTTNVTAGLDEDNTVPVGPPAVRLVAIVRRPVGSTRRSAPVVVTRGPAVIRNALLATGVSAADDGAVAAVEVSRAACPPGGASTVRAGGTTDGGTVLSVSAATPSLVQQDTQLPVIVSVIYPPTAQGEPVNVTVTATNEGGGRRRGAGGDGDALVPTALTYQWLRQGRAFTQTPGDTAPDMLAGETASVLRLPAAKCLSLLGSCGRFGCSGLEQYQVDVCNTFGCVRSGIIQPAILRPDDEQLALDLEQSSRCTFVS